MFVEMFAAGFVPTGMTVSRLFWKLMELIRLAYQLQRRDLSHQRWTGRPSAGARFLCPTFYRPSPARWPKLRSRRHRRLFWNLGTRPVAPKEVARLCICPFRNPPRFDLMHEGKPSRAVIDFR